MIHIKAEELTKKYAEGTQVLRGASLEIRQGERVAMLGSSGSGKSTFLHCLGLLDSIDAGRVIFDGQDMSQLSSREAARFRLNNLGFVFQFHHLIPELSALENVLLPASLKGENPKAYAEQLLELFGLQDRRFAYPPQLSGGEQQRVALARALINKPGLLLTDELTGNLDHERALEIMKILVKINEEFKTTLFSVTHDLEIASYYHRQYRLVDGKAIEVDTRSP